MSPATDTRGLAPHLRFFAPVLDGVTAHARVIKLGRTLAPVLVDLTDDRGKLVAHAGVTYMRLGSPAPHDVPASSWFTWTSGYDWLTQYGYTYVNFPPLFGHQYSHCWIDFHAIQDGYMTSKGITYFENSRRATLAQRAYWQ